MPDFSVFKNGEKHTVLQASGNVAALCECLNIKGVPAFDAIATNKGFLYAEYQGDIYVVVDLTITPVFSRSKFPAFTANITACVEALLSTYTQQSFQHVV